MTEDNVGTIINTAEILEDYNEKDIKDVDSTAGNKKANEDDISTVSLIVSISTGAVYVYIALAIIVVAILFVGVYIIKKKVLTNN